MRRLSLALSVVVLSVSASCNCGKPVVTNTTNSIALAGDVIEFGIVAEGTSKGGKFRVDNVGRAPANISVTMVEGSSADFTIGTVPMTIEAGGFVEVPVVFTPVGAGEDFGNADVNVVGSTEMALRVRFHGGPIFPALDVVPDPVDFRPSTMPLERKTVQLKSVGTSALTIGSVGVAGNGNPDFSVEPPPMPTRLLPGESVGVRVDYARSARTTEGTMEVLSDDADAGLRRVRLIPDPPGACSDGVDNDSDGLSDFPNDPGCQDSADSDEYNPSQCVNGAVQPCGGGDGGFCSGMRSCMNGLWGMCSGAGTPVAETCNNIDDDCNGQVDNGVTRGCYTGAANTRMVGNCRDGQETCNLGMWVPNCVNQVLPAANEVCGNGIDDNCNGATDEGCTDAGMTCNPNGVFSLDAGVPRITYSCCDGLGFPLVDVDIASFQIQNSAASVRPSPSQPQMTLPNPAPAATCPSGTFEYHRTITGTCDETYTLRGQFVGPNAFVGTYTIEFSGQDCVGNPLCGGNDCTNQSWNISAGR